MTTSTPISLREKNKARLRGQIVDAAAALLGQKDFSGLTADDIAAKAEVGRATFFRYFDSKEAAVVAAFYEQRLSALVTAMNAAPPALEPMDAIIWAFARLEGNFARQRGMILLQSRMVAASPGLRAKALEYQARYSEAMAQAIAPRYKHLGPHDLRPRLLSVATLMVVTSTIDYWAEGNGKLALPQLVSTALDQLKNGFSEEAGKSVGRKKKGA
jgi:AcrR family transcriptional regulator